MSTVLVAGAAGLLGSAVADRLLGQGDIVVGADLFDDSGDGREAKEERARIWSGHPRASLARVDLTDPLAVEALFAEKRPALVVNAARFDPAGAGCGALLTLAKASSLELFLHVSDGALYGPEPEPGRRANEDEPLDPGTDPWLRSKAAAEDSVRAAAVPFVILRVFELLAPRAPIARFPMSELEAILVDEEVYLTEDAPRDYLHVADAARGVALALKGRPFGETINLGRGLAARPKEVLEELARQCGKTLVCHVTDPAGPERRPRIADVERAWSLMEYAPQFGIETIADEILGARFAGVEPAPGLRREVEAPRRRSDEGPTPVSRRDLFGMFRRPFERK